MKLNKEKVAETILVMLVGFLIIFYFTKWQWLLVLDIFVGLSFVVYYPLAKNIVKGWLKFSEILGLINGKIILSIIFFLFLTPLSYLYRLFNKKELLKKSSWKKRNHKFDSSEFEKVW